MAYTADPRVDAYIDALPDWQQAICGEVRDLVAGVQRLGEFAPVAEPRVENFLRAELVHASTLTRGTDRWAVARRPWPTVTGGGPCRLDLL